MEVTFKFDSASAYSQMLVRQRRNMNMLEHEISQLGLDAHELLAHMHRYAGMSDADADARGAAVAKPVAHIRDSLKGVQDGLTALLSQLRAATEAMAEDDARRRTSAARLKI